MAEIIACSLFILKFHHFSGFSHTKYPHRHGLSFRHWTDSPLLTVVKIGAYPVPYPTTTRQRGVDCITSPSVPKQGRRSPPTACVNSGQYLLFLILTSRRWYSHLFTFSNIGRLDGGKYQKSSDTTLDPTLSGLGVSKDASSLSQKIAAM